MQKRHSKIISISIQPETLYLLDEMAKDRCQNRSELLAKLVLEENHRQNQTVINKVKSLLDSFNKR